MEIRIVEFMCGEDPIGREGHGPRFSRAAGARLKDVAEWEHGAVTPVVAELGPPGLDTLDTLIRAGFAATRPQAIRWALDRIRERRPASGSGTCSATPTPSRTSSRSSVLTGQNQWQNRFPKSRRANFDGSPQTCLLPLKKALPAQGSLSGRKRRSSESNRTVL